MADIDLKEGSSVRIATYIRISTDEENQPFSLEAQELRLAAYVKSQEGWQAVRAYSDRMTGSKLERPGLQRALADARAGRFDLLLVYRVDRLSRSVRGLAQILEELDRTKVSFRSATEPFDTGSPAGRMMVQMLGVFAEFERATIIDRVIAGMERKAARGGWNGGSIPFGYALDRETGNLVVCDDQAPVVSQIFEQYVKQRWGAHTIAAWLNERGHRSRATKPWSYRSVITVLRNQSYLGRIYFRGRYYPAAHSSLIDEALFQAANELLDERGEHPGRRRSNASDYLLAGLVRCHRCGRNYVGAAAHGNGGRYRYYVCESRNRRGSYGCDGQRLPADALESKLLEAPVATFSRTDLIDHAVQLAIEASHQAKTTVAERIAGVDAELSATRAALDRYFVAFERGTMNEAAAGERVEALAARVRELSAARAELESAAELELAAPVPSEEALATVRTELARMLTSPDSRAMKALLQELVAEVRVESRASILPVFKLPARSVRILDGLVDPRGFEPLAS